jgi:DNA-binding IclR family transcriptional regulator
MSTPRAQSLTRGLDLLGALTRYPHGATTATLARATDLAPATAGRLLITLADSGFVVRGEHGWVVGPELTRIAARADPHRTLREQARPLLERLAAAARESAMLAVPSPGPQLEILAQADGPRLLGLTDWVGRHVDLHASAAGKLVLAELSEADLVAWIRRERPQRLTPHTLTSRRELVPEIRRARQNGWATLDQESEIGLGSIACAARDGDGALSAIVGFSGPAERLDYPTLLAHLQPVCAALS